jgi:hypothetical protein
MWNSLVVFFDALGSDFEFILHAEYILPFPFRMRLCFPEKPDKFGGCDDVS